MSGAIEAISKQLQGEISCLRGFSPTNMKNMRTFYEEWSAEFSANRQLPTADLNNNDILPLNRQSVTGDLDETKIAAFCRVGFTHHREILQKCKTLEERWYYIFSQSGRNGSPLRYS